MVVVVCVSVSVCLSVCLSVTMPAATYLVCKSKVRCYKVPYGVSNLKPMYCVDFAENALFPSFGVICLQPLPSWEVVDGQDEQHWALFKVCSFSDSSCKLTDSPILHQYALFTGTPLFRLSMCQFFKNKRSFTITSQSPMPASCPVYG